MTINYEESIYIVPVRVKYTVGDVVVSKRIGYTPTHLTKERNDFDQSDEWKECES